MIFEKNGKGKRERNFRNEFISAVKLSMMSTEYLDPQYKEAFLHWPSKLSSKKVRIFTQIWEKKKQLMKIIDE
jgi:hypothetical protein